MAEFDFDAAKQVIENGIGEAQSVLEDPAKMDALLDSLKEKAADLPGTVTGALVQIPTLAAMAKSFVTKEYTEVPVKTIASVSPRCSTSSRARTSSPTAFLWSASWTISPWSPRSSSSTSPRSRPTRTGSSSRRARPRRSSIQAMHAAHQRGIFHRLNHCCRVRG